MRASKTCSRRQMSLFSLLFFECTDMHFTREYGCDQSRRDGRGERKREKRKQNKMCSFLQISGEEGICRQDIHMHIVLLLGAYGAYPEKWNRNKKHFRTSLTRLGYGISDFREMCTVVIGALIYAQKQQTTTSPPLLSTIFFCLEVDSGTYSRKHCLCKQENLVVFSCRNWGDTMYGWGKLGNTDLLSLFERSHKSTKSRRKGKSLENKTYARSVHGKKEEGPEAERI